ncbi:putative oxidoreductase [BD1-7 clade bacterium]|uniref:Putative oxidoreductase n=1 Tax=BD1-7 clade bacterium TaxID=2029982 RepID=A0A5S9P3T8_9GAMM|nr:putative oxidoreductase [BD1-7 clade bacterium]
MPKTILITGCSSGIGKALADSFTEIGCQVIATARDVKSMQELKLIGCDVQELDINNEKSVERLVEYIKDRYGALDILINNAGISAMGPIAEIPKSVVRQQFETNVVSQIYLTQRCLPLLLRTPTAQVVNIGSVSGILTTPFAGAYCASKSAFHAISEAMRMELLPLGIHVFTVQPGAIISNFGHNSAKGIDSWLLDNSLYTSIKQSIFDRAHASQNDATDTKVFADKLIRSLNQRSGTTIKIGKGSRYLALMARWLPEKLRHQLLSRRFGLNDLTRSLPPTVSNEGGNQ